jgi:hypothetical protein
MISSITSIKVMQIMRDNIFIIVMMMAKKQSYEGDMSKFPQQPVIFL